MEMTANQIARTKRDWEIIAKETIELEQICDCLYAFGSELGCYRIYYKFRYSATNKIKVGFSTNLNKWYFYKDMEV